MDKEQQTHLNDSVTIIPSLIQGIHLGVSLEQRTKYLLLKSIKGF